MSAVKHVALPMLVAGLVLLGFWRGAFPPSTARSFLNQRRAVQGIRAINEAEQTYAARHPNAAFACTLSDLGEHSSEPAQDGLLDNVLSSGTKSYYHFE